MGMNLCQCFKNENEKNITYTNLNSVQKIKEKSIERGKVKPPSKPGKETIYTKEKLRGKVANLSSILDTHRKDVLEEINKHRKEHGAKNLIINIEINSISQQFAEHLAEIDDLQYSKNEYNNQYLGECIYQSYKKMTPEELVNQWYNDINDYEEETDTPNNFSQLVWKSSQEFGFGISKSRSGNFYAVGNFYPEGNVKGYFRQNVDINVQNINDTNEY